MIFVIYGEERLLMDNKLQALQKEYNCDDENMNFSVYYGDQHTMKEIEDDLCTPPFFTENKMVVLYHPYFLTTKRIKKENNDDEAILLGYLKKDNPNTIFVLFHDAKDFDNRKKVVKQLRKEVTFLEYDKLSHHKIKETIRKSIIKRQSSIDEDALELLVSRIDNDLLIASKEVEKLTLYTNNITIDIVELLVNKPLEENVFALTSAIVSRDQQRMFSIYKDLLVLNEEPVKLIILVAGQLRLLYQVKLLDRKGYTDKEIGSILSVNPYRLKYVRQEGGHFEIQELVDLLDELSKLDIGIKTGKIDKKLGFELFMLKL